MIIVGLTSGLGNQMFEYDIYLALKERRSDVKLTDYWFTHNLKKHSVAHEKRNLLPEIFNLNKAEYAGDADVEKVADVDRGFFSRMRREKLKLYKKTHVNIYDLEHCNHIYEESSFLPWVKCRLIPSAIRRFRRSVLGSCPSEPVEYQRELIEKQLDEIASMKDAYLTGYWLNYDYIKPIEDKVRSEFTFKNPLDDKNRAIAQQMADELSVSVHIRRGDMLGTKVCETEHSMDYFVRAMSYFTDRFGIENVHFYCFSDDIPWCREHFKAGKITFVDWNTGDDSWRDMQLMSLCKHNIITNSTFSTWGAWLNTNPSKTVIRPHYYFNGGVEKPFPDEWIVMENFQRTKG